MGSLNLSLIREMFCTFVIHPDGRTLPGVWFVPLWASTSTLMAHLTALSSCGGSDYPISTENICKGFSLLPGTWWVPKICPPSPPLCPMVSCPGGLNRKFFRLGWVCSVWVLASYWMSFCLMPSFIKGRHTSHPHPCLGLIVQDKRKGSI